MTKPAAGSRHTSACVFSPSAMPETTEFAVRRALMARTLGAASIFCAGLGQPAWALRPRAESPEVAVDPLLAETGLTARWAAAMRRDLGWAAQWHTTPSRLVLDRLESGEAEVGLFLSHPRAGHLEKEGLIHDRRKLARTEVWLVGPADDPAGIRAEKDPARAIAQVLAAQAAGVASWQTGLPGEPAAHAAADSPLAQLAAQLLAQPATGQPLTAALANKQLNPSAPAYRLVTQAAWLRQGQVRGTRVWFQGHPALVLHAEVARSFRGKHPGGKLLVDWLDRPLARGTLRGVAGWQNAKG